MWNTKTKYMKIFGNNTIATESYLQDSDEHILDNKIQAKFHSKFASF